MSEKSSIRPEVLSFRDSLQTVVSLLTSRKIRVVDFGTSAYCAHDKKTGELLYINIPSIPDSASDALLCAIRGFVDHEVAHVLFTNPKISTMMSSKVSHALWNVVEDTFIERKMSSMFTGSRKNLIKVQKHLIESFFEPKIDTYIREYGKNNKGLFLDIFLMPVSRAYCGHGPFIEFMEPYWGRFSEELAVLDSINYKTRINRITKSEGSAKLAADLLRAFREKKKEEEKLKDPTPKPEEPTSESEKPEDEEKDKTTSKPSKKAVKEEEEEEEKDPLPEPSEKTEELEPKEEEKKEDEKSTSSPTDEKEEKDSHDDTSEPVEPEDHEPSLEDHDPLEESKHDRESESRDKGSVDDFGGGGDGDTADSLHDEDSEEEEGEESEKGSEPKEESEEEELSADDMKELDSKDAPESKSIEDASSELIASEMKSISGSTYLPFSRVNDFMGPLEDAHKAISEDAVSLPDAPWKNKDARRYIFDQDLGLSSFRHNIEKNLTSKSSTLAKDLERAIASRNRVQKVGGLRRGKINSPSLWKIAVPSINDDRVFSRKEEHRAVNAAVQIVIDLSGSMGGERIVLATAAAYALSDALDKIKVPNIVTGYTTVGVYDTRKSSRKEPLFLPTLKKWNEKSNSSIVRARLGSCCGLFPLKNNVDGESILALSRHHIGRTEDRQIMLVLSDGQPAAHGHNLRPHLIETADYLLNKAKIDLLAVGIQTDAPSHYYKHHTKVDSLDDLPKTVIAAIRNVLLGNGISF
ncbi:hypothetical protein QU516_17370 (plasmid) [Moellerella wisconsensis]|uniref:cobaltochelatase CobT-related protein n=1 Tax=Moellerella wisconsensis TaxID=158849 RepID=UPI0025B13335|nr:hypothetical protein [Moellerella wisconsensis]WJW83908.1 hypothetical protein QU516_17370 [Moellerella wisconsensis]